MEFTMASFTIRYMKNEFRIDSYSHDRKIESGYGYVEAIFFGVEKFSSNVRGKKFFWLTKGERTNPFDECIAYLGRLLHGKWISMEEYTL